MQCLRLSTFERRSRLDVQSDASLPCPSPSWPEFVVGGAKVLQKVKSKQPMLRVEVVVAEVEGGPLESSCVDAGEG